MDLSAIATESLSSVTTAENVAINCQYGSIPLRTRLRNLIRRKPNDDKNHKKLGEWSATAIAGNDISSSCLYTAGICAQRGKFFLCIFNTN